MPKRPKLAPAFILRPGESITFVLPVTPRTKKNSRKHIKRRSKSGKVITVPLPSDAYSKMEAEIVAWANDIPGNLLVGCVVRCACELELAQPLNCAAIFYRQKNIGDAVGYYQALADALEAAGIVADDKWITQWDGSRLAKDADRSRIEVTLRALTKEEIERMPDPDDARCPTCGHCYGE